MEDLELQTKVTEMLQQEKSQLRDTIHDLEGQSRSLDSKLLNEKVANDRFKIIYKEQSIELTET
jgi:t-SNARE complex subunit (syntaxin)